MTRKYADVVLPGVVVRREGRHVHEHRAPDQPRARGRAASRRRQGRPRDRHPHGEGARSRLARVPGRRVGLERARRPRAELVRRPLRPDRGERRPVAGDRRSAGPTRRSCMHPRPRGRRARQVLPGRVPAADRGAGLRVPARPLHRADALPLQLGDDDHARVGDHRQAGGPVLRDLGGGRLCARPRRGRLGAARLASRDARGAGAHLGPRLPRSRLDGAPLRRAEGQLAHARRRRPADRDAGVQGQRRPRVERAA